MKHNRKLVRVLALVLVALLVGGVIVGALFAAMAEEQTPRRDQYTLEIEYLEDQQALQVSQRLVYVNRSEDPLDRVLFYAMPNMFRRQTALMYESGDLDAVFPGGYAPGGIDLRAVRVNGEAAEYGFQGEDELYLRVACDIESGASASFEFDYYLLFVECNAFIGAGDTDVRLGAFYFIPGVYDGYSKDFILKKPLPFTRWLYTGAADYDVTLTLPEGYIPACAGEARDGRVRVENLREFALSFSRRWRETRRTGEGYDVRVLSASRNAARVARAAEEAVERCAEWFGAPPFETLTIAQSDYPLEALNYPGVIQLSGDLFERKNEAAMKQCLRFCVAQQYFGLSACPEPSADAWLSDSVSTYVAALLLEDAEGRDAFLNYINREWVSALQLTVPGGLRITSDAMLFDGKTYDIVVLRRGAVVFNELREAMGLEGLLEGLKAFYRLGQDGHTLTEMELVGCLDSVSGGSWEDFLTDWVFNVGDYVNQPIDWLS